MSVNRIIEFGNFLVWEGDDAIWDFSFACSMRCSTIGSLGSLGSFQVVGQERVTQTTASAGKQYESWQLSQIYVLDLRMNT